MCASTAAVIRRQSKVVRWSRNSELAWADPEFDGSLEGHSTFRQTSRAWDHCVEDSCPSRTYTLACEATFCSRHTRRLGEALAARSCRLVGVTPGPSLRENISRLISTFEYRFESAGTPAT
jgi:hypothetical protein